MAISMIILLLQGIKFFSASLLFSWKKMPPCYRLYSISVSCIRVENIADHSQSIVIIQIPDFVAFFFMSLILFSVESLQHLILRSLNCWNFYSIIQQYYAEIKMVASKTNLKNSFTDISSTNSKFYLCLCWVSCIR